MARVVILSRTSQWGLDTDAKLVEQVFREAHALKWLPIASIDHLDSYQFTNPKPVDIQVHLEVPCRQAWPWAKRNIVVVNPEWWVNKAWDWVLQTADLFIFKSPAAATLFPELDPKKVVIIPWRTPYSVSKVPVSEKDNKVLYLIGASQNKLEAAKHIVQAWGPKWPLLDIWGSPAVVAKLHLPAHKTNIRISSSYRSAEEKQKTQEAAKYHCVASVAEGFGYTMAECAAVGSLPLWVGLPVQDYLWGAELGSVGRIPPLAHQRKDSDIPTTEFREPSIQIPIKGILDAAATLFSISDEEYEQKVAALQRKVTGLQSQFREGWKRLLKGLSLKMPQPFVPRRLGVDEVPHVAVLTVTRNRPKWWANMTRNILLSDYPRDKLVWILVDDGDGMGRIDAQVQAFQEKVPTVRIQYVSLTKTYSVGEKRNRGCKAALAIEPRTEMFVTMDDDDHYPKSSIEARVSYLKEMKKGCVYCSTLPMYDCRRYISAMNVPPMDLSPAERVSEATLAFTRQFWESQPFPTISVAEGEGFLKGRESDTAEIPPDGIIVSFLHSGNSTSRRVPEKQEPNGCHYGFDDDFFTYLSERGMDPTSRS